ncbi:MAG: hypothetical protein PUG48_05685 [Clostridia bacterium]|nr:hypothetical protein [Clostridia bacterium]
MELSRIKYKLNKEVSYKGVKYRLTACILRYNEKDGYYYQAELQDLNANSVLICKLAEVEETKQEANNES